MFILMFSRQKWFLSEQIIKCSPPNFEMQTYEIEIKIKENKENLMIRAWNINSMQLYKAKDTLDS